MLGSFLLSTGYSSYVPYDPNLLFRALGILRANLGSAINIGLWIFVMLSGVYLVIHVVSSFGK